MAIHTISNNEIYSKRIRRPNKSTKHEARCFSYQCTKDKNATGKRGIEGILVTPVGDDECPVCGDYIVWKTV